MRFSSTLSRLALVVLSFATTGRVVSAADEYVSLTFGADFKQNSDGQYVQGGFTVVDDANFVTGLQGQIGTVTNVKWRFQIPPDRPPPSSVYIKVLKQKTDEPWRFQLVDQRVIVTRSPTQAEIDAKPAVGDPNDPESDYTPAGFLAQSYIDDILAFWNNPAGINLNSLTNGYYLKVPGMIPANSPSNQAAPLSIAELEFVGFYFPDKVSRVSGYRNEQSNFIEWVMPGNFDSLDWSPPMRFTFNGGLDHDTATENCATQQPIIDALALPPYNMNLNTVTSGRKNSDSAFINQWYQYRKASDCSPAEATNNALGYSQRSQWVEGFVSRQKHKDFFGFTVVAKKGPATGNGDPQFSGFQGQNFQFHGMADEVFNLISTPTFQMNGNFKYLSSGKCDYNETVCFTHPGTYVDQIGFTIGDIKIKAVAGSHEKGLRAWMNDIEIHRAHAGNNHKIIFAINNSTTETGSFQYTQTGRLSLDLPQFHVEVINSDYFFNMEVSLKDTSILRAGMKQVKLREKVLCASEGMKSSDRMEHVESRMAQHYPRVPIHGLIGQTWRNALVCDHPWVGDASDYVTSSLFATDSAFNYYGTSQ